MTRDSRDDVRETRIRTLYKKRCFRQT